MEYRNDTIVIFLLQIFKDRKTGGFSVLVFVTFDSDQSNFVAVAIFLTVFVFQLICV